MRISRSHVPLGTVVREVICGVEAPVRRRGEVYFAQSRVTSLKVSPERVEALVRGSRPTPYNVSIVSDPDGQQANCDCPMADGGLGLICKHQVALALAAREELTTLPVESWKSVMAAIDATPERKHVLRRLINVFFSLQRQGTIWRIVPYGIAVPDDTQPPTAEDALPQPLRNRPSSERVANFSPDQYRALTISLLLQGNATMGTLVQNELFSLFLSIVPDGLLYTGDVLAPLRTQATVLREALPLKLGMRSDNGSVRISLVGRRRDGEEMLVSGRATVVCQNPLWVDLTGCIFQPDVSLALWRGFAQASVIVPEAEAKEFAEDHLPALLERFPNDISLVDGNTVEATPLPRLYLSEQAGELRADLAFQYGEVEVPWAQPVPLETVRLAPDKTMIKVLRSAPEEDAAAVLAGNAGLKRAARSTSFRIKEREHALDFLLEGVPQLADAGFTVYGEAGLKSLRVNRSRPTMRTMVTSDIDWFDVTLDMTFGDTPATLSEIRKAVRAHTKFVKLADGSVGVLPQSWLDRLRRMLGIGDGSKDSIHIHANQSALIDYVTCEGSDVEWDEPAKALREKIAAGAQIEAQPLPEGLQAELRSYQYSGYNWLVFLRESECGGCLADDMGLGKTVQALTFLLRQHRSENATSPSLIVAPRSLIVNWMREAQRFTPTLRITPYLGIDRDKTTIDTGEFDVVLTTYGILLRDIGLLRRKHYECVVLDEAQAIKNPESRTARSVRLLNAKCRVALTGTPVENSTTDLWSLFAFLNPGLLGSASFFRTEFSTPIERLGEAEAATTLRRIVSPFILRRTKQQAAPELPPRTEEVVSVEMTDEQRAFYMELRDKYRRELVGMIDQSGLQSARFHVLEGLLRLRQAACHPRLVDRTYAGGSGKLDTLIESLTTLRAEGHKVLVFSQFVSVLRIVEEELDKLGLRYVILEGKTRDRTTPVDQFQSDPNIPFFLISLKAGGVGLNLTAADYVIQIDPWWNPAVEAQASDRAHRIGQERPVFVYKLVSEQSVEEKILRLQDRKRDLVDQLIQSEAGLFKSLTVDDVWDLFS
jgi:non-specific serine/threonine protein kinase